MRPEFAVTPLSTEGQEKLKTAAQAFSSLLDVVELLLGPGRELSLVKTKLQESHAWLCLGVAKENSEKT